MAYKTFTHQIRWVMVCYDLAHQIRWAKTLLVVGVISHLWCAARLVDIAKHSFCSAVFCLRHKVVPMTHNEQETASIECGTHTSLRKKGGNKVLETLRSILSVGLHMMC